MAHPKAKKRTTLYLRTAPNRHSGLLWVRGQKANEILMGLYGLDGGQATLRHIFPPVDLSQEELASVNFRLQDAQDVDIPIDHITCHANGRFQLTPPPSVKVKTGYLYRMLRQEPLGPETGPFLKFIVISNLAGKYVPVDGVTKEPSVSVDIDPGSSLFLRAIFSGADYPLLKQEMENTIAATKAVGGEAPEDSLQFSLHSGSMKGTFWTYERAKTSVTPPGTMLSFRFKVAGDKFHVLTFIFA